MLFFSSPISGTSQLLAYSFSNPYSIAKGQNKIGFHFIPYLLFENLYGNNLFLEVLKEILDLEY